MKIAVWHNLPSGGGKRALYDQVRGLVERGHTVESWCPPTADRTFLPLSDLIPEHIIDLKLPLPFNLLQKLGITREIEKSLAAMDAHCRKCADEINSGDFDILFANSCQFFRTTSIGRYVVIPSVLYLQEPYRWLYEALPRLPWLARPSDMRIPRSISELKAEIQRFRIARNAPRQGRAEVENASAFDRILVNSFFSRESVLRAYGISSTVCYLGIDIEKFLEISEEREDYILGLGAITFEKNIRFCIEAISKLSHPRPRLIWVGNVADPKYLEEMIQLANHLSIDFLPMVRVSEKLLLQTMRKAMVLLYAPRLEPFGLAPLEANACGIPVIAVAEGGVRETVIDNVNGFLVASNPTDMASAITRIQNDPKMAQRLGAQGRAIAKDRWSLGAASDRLEAELNKICGN